MKRSTVLRLLSWLCCFSIFVALCSWSIIVSIGPTVISPPEPPPEPPTALGIWIDSAFVTVPLLLIGLWLRKAANAAERREEGKGAKG